MQADSNPFFRKSLIPWYDSDAACVMMLLVMCLVLLFGFAGIRVARSCPDFHAHVWIPLLLMALSGGTGISILIRLFRRRRLAS